MSEVMTMPTDPHLPQLPAPGGPNFVPSWWGGKVAERRARKRAMAAQAAHWSPHRIAQAPSSSAEVLRKSLEQHRRASGVPQPEMALEILNGPVAGHCLPWHGGQMRLNHETPGLGDDPKIARRQAVLHPDTDGGYLVEDLGSPGGTFVNGGRVRGRMPLEPGDELQIGDRRLRVISYA
ncbi:FHA domain-containing protein [Streptomyces sp. NPDC049577]|uniref:FHA domain-containing protein n=1 Tax=Streptomyces sp. NPDC049577 TaxID=3155153 RepID=UPI00342FB2C1